MNDHQCAVYRGSQLDDWGPPASRLATHRCPNDATWVVEEGISYTNEVCDLHKRVWERHQEVRCVLLSPVTQDEVTAAIESIRNVRIKHDEPASS